MNSWCVFCDDHFMGVVEADASQEHALDIATCRYGAGNRTGMRVARLDARELSWEEILQSLRETVAER